MRWLVLIIAMTLPIAAAAQPSPVPLGPTILDTGSQVVRVESFTLTAPGQGADYRIGVLIPRRPAPETGFPALYLLDGQAAAELLTDEVLGALDPETLPVIVTLGYAGDARFAGHADHWLRHDRIPGRHQGHRPARPSRWRGA